MGAVPSAGRAGSGGSMPVTACAATGAGFIIAGWPAFSTGLAGFRRLNHSLAVAKSPGDSRRGSGGLEDALEYRVDWVMTSKRAVECFRLAIRDLVLSDDCFGVVRGYFGKGFGSVLNIGVRSPQNPIHWIVQSQITVYRTQRQADEHCC